MKRPTHILYLLVISIIFTQLPLLCTAQKSQQYIPYRIGNKWGISDTLGKMLIQPKFDEALFMNEKGYIKVRKGKNWGIFGPEGKFITRIKYEKIVDQMVFGNFYIYKKYNIHSNSYRQGIIDSSGHTIIPARFSSATFAYQNNKVIIVSYPNQGKKRQIGFVDTTGKFLLQHLYSNVIFNKNSYIKLQDPSTDLFGLMNPNGKMILPFNYGKIFDFQEGLILVKDYNALYTGGFHFMDQYGKPAFKGRFHTVIGGFSNGLVAIGNEKGKFGYIDRQGNQIIDLNYDEATEFRNGVAIVKKGDFYGVIDLHEKIVEPFVYEDLKWDQPVSKSGSMKEISKTNHYTSSLIIGVINGKRIYGLLHKEYKLPIKYRYLHPNSNNLQGFKGYIFQENNCYGVLDSTGKIVLPPVFESIIPAISEGRFPVLQTNSNIIKYGVGMLVKEKTGLGLVDSAGKFIKPFIFYPRFNGFKDGIALVQDTVRTKWRYSIINKKGNPISDFTFEEVRQVKNGFIIFKNAENDKIKITGFGLINSEGKIVTQQSYRRVSNFTDEGIALVDKEAGTGIIDKNGNEIIPAIYDLKPLGSSEEGPILHCGYLLVYDLKNNRPVGYMSLKQKKFWQD
ncbi:WG repeat-containing protein [Adhaeribacter soli]|uniref:WG repeat-containing protein n=1 Tax=Adhaeribacter soli TaxID=2607655 RepID=A0A5N1J340_9BACT|nr:WG repeat-containing protein [Adhaeribacter soli]KAA9338973.1 WG repeat-containing protein [Adhaeribacter soli]